MGWWGGVEEEVVYLVEELIGGCEEVWFVVV